MSRGMGPSLSHCQVHQGSSHCVPCHSWPLSSCPHPGAPESLRGAGFGDDSDAASGWHGSGGTDAAKMCSGARRSGSCGEVGHGAHQGQDDSCSWCSISECGREGSHYRLPAGDRVPRGYGGNGVVGRREWGAGEKSEKLGNAVSGGKEKPGCALGVDVHEVAEADDHSALHLLETKYWFRKKSSSIAKYEALFSHCSSKYAMVL